MSWVQLALRTAACRAAPISAVWQLCPGSILVAWKYTPPAMKLAGNSSFSVSAIWSVARVPMKPHLPGGAVGVGEPVGCGLLAACAFGGVVCLPSDVTMRTAATATMMTTAVPIASTTGWRFDFDFDLPRPELAPEPERREVLDGAGAAARRPPELRPDRPRPPPSSAAGLWSVAARDPEPDPEARLPAARP